jgi:alkylhydroperoxidase family enzyme
MSRLEPVQPDDLGLDADTAALIRKASGRTGRLSNVIATLANNPAALRGLLALGDAVYVDGLLSPDRRELVYLAASVENSCHY